MKLSVLFTVIYDDSIICKEKRYARKKLAGFTERYKRLYYELRNMRSWKRVIKKEMLSENFNSRIMLAVTEVKGRTVCSYAQSIWYSNWIILISIY